MATLSGSGWNSAKLGTLNSGVAALGRRSLTDALGAYGGFSELAEALTELNDGEFIEAADELEEEAKKEKEKEEKEGPVNKANRADKELVMPDIAETFTRLIGDLVEWTKSIGKAARNKPEHKHVVGSGDYWFVPRYQAVLAAAANLSPTAEDLELISSADVLNISKMHLHFDRDTLNEQYRDLHKEDNKSTTTGGAAVLKMQIDYTAAAERAYRLRHATLVRCTMHHSIRKEAHGHDVGVFEKTLAAVQATLKASAPPPPSTPVAVAIQLALAAIAAGNNAQAAALLANYFDASTIQRAIAAAAGGGIGMDQAREILLNASKFNDS
jgi:hypothetical protein